MVPLNPACTGSTNTCDLFHLARGMPRKDITKIMFIRRDLGPDVLGAWDVCPQILAIQVKMGKKYPLSETLSQTACTLP